MKAFISCLRGDSPFYRRNGPCVVLDTDMMVCDDMQLISMLFFIVFGTNIFSCIIHPTKQEALNYEELRYLNDPNAPPYEQEVQAELHSLLDQHLPPTSELSQTKFVSTQLALFHFLVHTPVTL